MLITYLAGRGSPSRRADAGTGCKKVPRTGSEETGSEETGSEETGSEETPFRRSVGSMSKSINRDVRIGRASKREAW